ncbi:hypothetical protein BD626DRAFT_396430, partial [Schizophyllum amplum]
MSHPASPSSSRPRWVQGLLHPRSSGVFSRSRSPSRERSTTLLFSSISLPLSNTPVSQPADLTTSTTTVADSRSTLPSQEQSAAPSPSLLSLSLSSPSVIAPASSAESSTTSAVDSQSTLPAILLPVPPPRPVPADPITALWEHAIERYRNETGIDLLAQDGVCFESESAILRFINEQEKSFSQFRADGPQRLRTALAPVAAACGPLCAMAGEGVGLVFAPSKLLFTAIGELVKATVKVSEELDSIVDAFHIIEHHLRILKPVAARDVLHDDAIREASVKLLAQILVVFGVIQKVQNNGRLVIWLKKLNGSNQVSTALDELGRLATNQHQTISAVTLFTVKETMAILTDGKAADKHKHEVTQTSLACIAKTAQGIHDTIRRSEAATQGQIIANRGILENIQRALLQQINEMSMDRKDTDMEKIYEWLEYPDSSVKMNTLLEERAASTGSWFLDGEEYSAFKLGKTKSIWLHGKAGSGKSTMIAAAIKDIEANLASSSAAGLTVTHLFDTTNGRKNRTLRDLVSSLLCQLALKREECATELLKLRQASSMGRSQLSLEVMQRQLDSLIQTMPMRVFIVVDALDEADDDNIIPFLEHLRAHANVSLLFSSRHEVLFRAQLEKISDSQIPMEEILVAEDITTALEQLLCSGGALDTKTDQNTKDRIREVIRATADGNFRWAALQLRELGAVAGIPRKVLQRLETIPKTLAEDYERRLQSIDSADREDVLCLLTWSLFSYLPLSTVDFAQLLSFDYSEGMPVFNASMQPSSVLDVLSLVGSTFLCERDGHVRISHASVKDYLLTLPLESPFHIDSHGAYSLMARMGLAYLRSSTPTDPGPEYPNHLSWTWVVYVSQAGASQYLTLEQDIISALDSCRTPDLLAAALHTATDIGH